MRLESDPKNWGVELIVGMIYKFELESAFSESLVLQQSLSHPKKWSPLQLNQDRKYISFTSMDFGVQFHLKALWTRFKASLDPSHYISRFNTRRKVDETYASLSRYKPTSNVVVLTKIYTAPVTLWNLFGKFLGCHLWTRWCFRLRPITSPWLDALS